MKDAWNSRRVLWKCTPSFLKIFEKHSNFFHWPLKSIKNEHFFSTWNYSAHFKLHSRVVDKLWSFLCNNFIHIVNESLSFIKLNRTTMGQRSEWIVVHINPSSAVYEVQTIKRHSLCFKKILQRKLLKKKILKVRSSNNIFKILMMKCEIFLCWQCA